MNKLYEEKTDWNKNPLFSQSTFSIFFMIFLYYYCEQIHISINHAFISFTLSWNNDETESFNHFPRLQNQKRTIPTVIISTV